MGRAKSIARDGARVAAEAKAADTERWTKMIAFVETEPTFRKRAARAMLEESAPSDAFQQLVRGHAREMNVQDLADSLVRLERPIEDLRALVMDSEQHCNDPMCDANNAKDMAEMMGEWVSEWKPYWDVAVECGFVGVRDVIPHCIDDLPRLRRMIELGRAGTIRSRDGIQVGNPKDKVLSFTPHGAEMARKGVVERWNTFCDRWIYDAESDEAVTVLECGKIL